MNHAKVVLVGLMGAGKTPIGEALAEELDRPFRDSDRELEARYGASGAEIADRQGMAILHEHEAAILLDLLADPEPAVVGAAASVVEDADCRRAMSASSFVVWLAADLEALTERAGDRSNRSLEDDVEAQLGADAARRNPLLEEIADLTVETTTIDPQATARRIADTMRSARSSDP